MRMFEMPIYKYPYRIYLYMVNCMASTAPVSLLFASVSELVSANMG